VRSRFSEASATSLMSLPPAVQARRFAGLGIDAPAELCRDNDLITDRSESFTQQLFVGERAIDFRRVEEGDTTFNRRADESDGLFLFSGRAVTEARSHAAKAESGDLEALSKFTLRHGFRGNRAHISVGQVFV
jgi:hypothetical protein